MSKVLALPVTPAERLVKAYEVARAAAPGLVLNNDPASGYWVLAHAALVEIAHIRGAEAAAQAADAFAATLRAAGAIGWARRPSEHDPRPAA